MFLLATARSWPDAADLILIAVFLALAVGLPLCGLYLMAKDFRTYLRRLRGALIKSPYGTRRTPEWVRQETPACLRCLGLQMPCTEQDVHEAYVRLAAQMHPDRGGDQYRFRIVIEHFEAAVEYVRSTKY